MLAAIAMLTLVGAEPSETQLELLRTFRGEFITLTPGTDPFPHGFDCGRLGGPSEERPPHHVKLGYKFHIARYEVPQNLWLAVTGRNPSRWQGDRNSVEMLSFDDAVQFCRQATRLMRAAKLIDVDQQIRLPSEAEWEYAARSGTTTAYSFGDDAKLIDEYGWHTGNAAGNDPPVGAKRPNAWGLYDVHGYLWEWCADQWHDDYAGAPTDGRAWEGDDKTARRVLRGGSWKDAADRCTSTARRPAPGDLRDAAVGLRCVLAVANDE